ncbi:MAG: formate dehydrogenase, partial [Brevibacterium yomogidense]
MARFSPLEWPVLRQFRSGDVTGRGPSVTSGKTRATKPRTSTSDAVVKSVCPYCAVGCGQNVFVRDNRVVQIEGDPDSPISRGRLCPKGAASEQLVNSPGRVTDVLYRAPRAKDWQTLDLETATDMIADR